MDNDQLVSANSLDALGENVARIIGPSVGGILLATFGMSTVALINAGAFVIAVILIYFIRQPDVSEAVSAQDPTRHTLIDFWREWLSGLRLVMGERTLAFVFLAAGISLVGDSILGVLLVVFVQDVVGAGAEEFGWILTAWGVGGVLGGLIVARFGPPFSPKNLMGFGMAGMGVVLLIMVHIHVLPVVLASAVVVGLPVMAWMIAGQTWLQEHTEDLYRGRVFGAIQTYAAMSGLLGMGFATFAGETIGVTASLSIGAMLFILTGVFCSFFYKRRCCGTR